MSWKVYNLGWDSVPYGNTDNVFVFWKKYAHDMRTRGSKGAFINDARKGRLPQVSWLIPSYARGWDEHPPADVSVGMGIQEDVITALRDSPQWDSSAFMLTYDEHGGYFDHVPPPQLDAFGLGIRVPTWVISPYAKTRPDRDGPAGRFQLDAQAARAAARSADARLGQPQVRRGHAHRRQLPGRRRAGAAAG